MSHSKSLRAVLLTGILAIAIQPGVAAADEGAASEGGWGALAAVSSLLYGPVKVVYATTGLIFGGIAWGLSGGDSEVLTAVITPAVRGDYVITPSHIRGERTLEFFGRSPGYQPMDVAAERQPVAPITPRQDYMVEETY